MKRSLRGGRWVAAGFLLFPAVLTACGDAANASRGASTMTAPMPAGGDHAFNLGAQSEEVVARYRFVESQPALANRIPCYCNCQAFGHRSLRDCFLKQSGGYEAHASVCGVCLTEAQDIEEYLTAGLSIDQMRAAIDDEYGMMGKPTATK